MRIQEKRNVKRAQGKKTEEEMEKEHQTTDICFSFMLMLFQGYDF